MSCEDIEEAREKRAAKEAAKEAAAVSGKRGWKRKSSASAGAKSKMVRRSEVEVTEDEIAAAGLGRLLLCPPILIWIG
jgi:hypothetical protein